MLIDRTPGMVLYIGPIFIELLSRLRSPPSTRTQIASLTALESSALPLSGLRFKFPRGSRCGGEKPFLRSKLEMSCAHASFFGPTAATIAGTGAVWDEYPADDGK